MARALTKWNPDMQGFRDDFAHWLAMPEQGKSLETAKLYAIRAARWLQGGTGSLEFINEAGNPSERKIRRSALTLLASYDAYVYDREIVLPPIVDQNKDGQHAEILGSFRVWMRANGLSRIIVNRYSMYVRHALLWRDTHPEEAGYPYRGFVAGTSTPSIRIDALKSLYKFRIFMRAEYPRDDPRRPRWLPRPGYSQRKPPVYLSIDEAWKVGQHLRYHGSRLAYAAWSLAYGVGMRACELVNLEVTDITGGETGMVRILNSKNGSSRDVPIPTQTQAAVRAYLEHERHERARFTSSARVFLGPRGQLWRPREVRAEIAAAVEMLGSRKIHQPLHMWRWMYATHLSEQMRAANGAPDWQVLARLLGHKNITTTQMYVGEVSYEQLFYISHHLNPMSKPPIEEWKTEAELRRARQASLEVLGHLDGNRLRSSSASERLGVSLRQNLVS